MRRVVLLSLCLTALLAAGPAVLPGRTLTAADGRAIEAEVLGFEGLEKVRIKRADTGQTFTVPLATFAEADQQALRKEAAEAASKPVALQKGDVMLDLSRLRFESRKTKQDIEVDGTTIRDAIAITEEDWGYTLTLTNKTSRPIENLRAEYFLYIKVDALKNSSEIPRVRREKFSLTFDVLPAQGRLATRSDAVTTTKTELKDGLVWSGTSDKKTRDSLEGIWLRIYRDDQLVLETASPPSLATTGRWTEEAGQEN